MFLFVQVVLVEQIVVLELLFVFIRIHPSSTSIFIGLFLIWSFFQVGWVEQTVDLRLYGEPSDWALFPLEKSVAVTNHMSAMDWLMLWVAGERAGCLPACKV